MPRASLAALFVLAGCRLGFDGTPVDVLPDADVTPPADYTSGTRLRALVYDAPGTPSLTQFRWFDNQLGEECTVMTAEDGTLRCFPDRAGHGFQYADAACTVPLMRMRDLQDAATCPSAAQIGFVETSVRSSIYRAARIGPLYTGALYQEAGGGCQMLTGSSGDYYEVGAVVPLDQLARFTEEIRPAGTLGYVQNVSADGAQYLDSDHLVDMATGERCALIEQQPGEVQCQVERPYGSLVHADATCSTRAVVTYQQPDAAIIQVNKYGLCGPTSFDVTAGAPLTTYYVMDAGVCSARAADADYHAWIVDGMQPTTGIVAGSLETNGSGPIVRGRWRFTSGHSLPGLLFDRTRNDHCYPIALVDTFQVVCAPLWTGTPTTIFSDASCTVAVGGWPSCAGSWRSTWYPGIGQETCDGTGIGMFVRMFDAPIAGPLYWSDDGVCTPVPASVTVSAMSTTDYPATEMVPLTRRRE